MRSKSCFGIKPFSARPSSQLNRARWILDPAGGGGLGGGGVRSEKDQACRLQMDRHSARGFRAGLRGGMVFLSSRPHAAVYSRSFDRSDLRAATGCRMARRRRERVDTAGERFGLRAGVSRV